MKDEGFLMIPPMKIWQLPKDKKHLKDKVCNSGEYFGQIKKDGYWYMFEKSSSGKCYLFSRVISKDTGLLTEKSKNVPHIIEYLDSKLPNGTILIGEIYYPNKTSKDVTKIMGCLPDKAIERQNKEYGKVHYYIFDVLYYSNNSALELTNLQRYILLKDIAHTHNLYDNEYIEIAESYFTDLSYRIDKSIEDGEEGMVLKKKDAYYVPDKRPAWNMIKFKIEDEYDVICTGFTKPEKVYKGDEISSWQYWLDEETGKIIDPNEMPIIPSCKEDMLYRYTPITKPYYKGWVGGLEIGVFKDGEIMNIGRVSSGLSDEVLEDIKHNPNKYLNKPIKVKAMMAYEESLRHPVFIGLRDDINIEDCTYEKIFN